MERLILLKENGLATKKSFNENILLVSKCFKLHLTEKYMRVA